MIDGNFQRIHPNPSCLHCGLEMTNNHSDLCSACDRDYSSQNRTAMITKQFPIYFTHVNGFDSGMIAIRCDDEKTATFVYPDAEHLSGRDDWYQTGMNYVNQGEWKIITAKEVEGQRTPIRRKDARHTECVGPKRMTVRQLREWLATLPEEFQDAPFQASLGGLPHGLKRIVAYQDTDGFKGVVANPLGTHLPFDKSLEWKHVLS